MELLEGKQSTFLWTFLSYSVTLGFNLPLAEETYHHKDKPLYFYVFPWPVLFLFSVLFLIKMTRLHLNVHSLQAETYRCPLYNISHQVSAPHNNGISSDMPFYFSLLPSLRFSFLLNSCLKGFLYHNLPKLSRLTLQDQPRDWFRLEKKKVTGDLKPVTCIFILKSNYLSSLWLLSCQQKYGR